jgi:hypothetical protein
LSGSWAYAVGADCTRIVMMIARIGLLIILAPH